MQSQKGFTLMELMIAVALVAIITMIAIPSYTGYTQRSARANAQAELMAAASAMERRKAQNFTYAGATVGTAATDTISSMSPHDASAGSQKYNITLTFLKNDGSVAAVGDTVGGYQLLAVSTAAFASGGTEALKLDHLGRKCYKPLGGSVTDCTFGSDPTWK
jgi:type IV pilus assembly protein PilE